MLALCRNMRDTMMGCTESLILADETNLRADPFLLTERRVSNNSLWEKCMMRCSFGLKGRGGEIQRPRGDRGLEWVRVRQVV